MKTYTTIAALALASVDARMWFGQCPTIEWESGMDHARFAGNWYEQKRDNWMTMDMGQECTTGAMRLRDDGRLDVQWRTFVPMNFMQYSQSPVMQMDCSRSFQCDFNNEDKTPEQQAESDRKRAESSFEFGILATDYDNWHVMYGCGEAWTFGNMQWFSIMGKQERISDEHIQEAIQALKDRVPGFDASEWLMKDGGQGDLWWGGKCEYEWDLDQIEKYA